MNGPNIAFLNEVERDSFDIFQLFIPCDALLTAALLFPECVRTKFDCFATVELSGRETRGQMCIGHVTKNPPNVTVIEKLDEEEIKKAVIFAADATNSN